MRVISKFAHSAAINANLPALVDLKRSTRQLFPRTPGPCPFRPPGGASATARSAPPRSTVHRTTQLPFPADGAHRAPIGPTSCPPPTTRRPPRQSFSPYRSRRCAASILNSSVNLRLVTPISDILPADQRSACQVSTNSGEPQAARVVDGRAHADRAGGRRAQYGRRGTRRRHPGRHLPYRQREPGRIHAVVATPR